ncbi:MAG TPA: glycosyltransferase family 4 protein [Bryobacteraceae bacterium]|nr:glycosyltransferase family 4 protein [Bryobacteraceae bacterium]
MKILFTADAYLPHAGGSRVYYHNVYKLLAEEHRDSVTVLTKEVPGWQAFDEQAASAQFHVIRRSKPLAAWKYHQLHTLLIPLGHTLSVLRKTKPDVLHIGDLYPQGLIGWMLKRLTGFPYIAYCHGEEITQMDRRRLEPIMRNCIYRDADGVIACSSFARENLIRIGVPKERITKINPGVDYLRFTPGPPSRELVQRFGLEGKRVLLTVARLVPRKGHAAVIEALAKIGHAASDIRYLVVGTGPELERLRGMVREKRLEQVVTFVGYVPDADLPDYYRAGDIMVMPNFEEPGSGDIEGFGMVFLEANAAGKPAIAGHSGGTAEAVLDGVTGYLVDPHNVDHLAARLHSLLADDKLRSALGQTALARVREEFSWQSRAAAIREVTLRVLNRTHVKPIVPSEAEGRLKRDRV